MFKSIIPFIFATITILAFQNCGTPNYDFHNSYPGIVYNTDAEFDYYIQKFESYYGKSTSGTPIAFDDLGPEAAGMCYRFAIGSDILYAYIKIDRKYWSQMSELQKINLIFHELGHCVMQRPHTSVELVRDCPTSMMYDTVMSNFCLEKYYDDYIKEMFQ